MDEVINVGVIAWVIIIWVVCIASMLKARGQKNSTANKGLMPHSTFHAESGMIPKNLNRKRTSRYKENIPDSIEDRNNDWLARQLRDESHYKSSFDRELGHLSAGNCDARKLKQSHEINCDARASKIESEKELIKEES